MIGATALDESAVGMTDNEKRISIAVAVIRDRLDSLPEEDRNELFELFAELGKTSDEEGRQSLWVAIREILAQEPIVVDDFSLVHSLPRSAQAQKWAEKVAAKVRELRTARGWTLEMLAERAALSTKEIECVERSEVTASYKSREKIAEAFGVDIESISFDFPE